MAWYCAVLHYRHTHDTHIVESDFYLHVANVYIHRMIKISTEQIH